MKFRPSQAANRLVGLFSPGPFPLSVSTHTLEARLSALEDRLLKSLDEEVTRRLRSCPAHRHSRSCRLAGIRTWKRWM
jgi:hypothetical protein